MKLQYLGDSRDAFKWDLLHWICTESLPSFSEMVFVPLLTPDIAGSNEGLTPSHLFECRDFIRPFVDSLTQEPRSMEKISMLGTALPQKIFRVTSFAPDRFISSGAKRSHYWADFDASMFENSVVFFDPDNGFETATMHSTKWIRHSELENIIIHLPKTSVAVVYQHRPRRKWSDLFNDLTKNLTYAHTVVVAYEPNLAFVVMAGNPTAGLRVAQSIQLYADKHPIVRHSLLRG